MSSISRPVSWINLSADQKHFTYGSIFGLHIKSAWPPGKDWDTIEELRQDVAGGYNPDQHFSFRLDDSNEATVEIG